ncbi:hypothetical protein IWW48_003127 [Coemansia sp. RSA 1200]|nr:hypothetical protein IWW48_003127 [Coemansia sp. RSA 1200]
MNLNSVMPANTHTTPINTASISAAHITRSVSTADLVSTVGHTGQNVSGNVLATPIASETLSVTAAATTAVTKEDSPVQSSKASSKTGNRKRARATSEQVTVLESVFMVNRSPASRVREDLAARLGMAPRQVQVWFQNRRAKEKTQQRNPRGLQHHPSILLDQLARESEASGITAVASPGGPGTPVSANNGTLGSRCDAAGRRPAPLTLVCQQHTAGPNGLASGGNGRPLQGDMGFGGINTGMAMALSGRLALGYSPFIPEIPSYMILDASRLSVGSWIRVPMDDTELTCHACVAPPPLKPVMRPGNHRPAELDSLIGEFQWIISSAGQRYKMVLSYSAISRIKFRELPDTAASLVDVSSDSVGNPQAAMSLLSSALKNPQAKGELSIHIYDLPTYYLQTANGSWKEIGDFSENLSASNTGVHTISGSFATLFYKLRILLATCSRLKIAADPLMSLWLGNMDDPYSAFSAIPHNAWTPCAEAVCLHSAKRSNLQAPDHEGSGNDKACLTPGMFSGVTTGDLPPALSTSGILPVFGAGMPINNVAAAIVTGASGIGSLPLKTQRSASLPFIRSGASNGGGTSTKANPSSSLCRSIESDGLLPVEADSPDALEQQPTNSDGSGNDSLAASSGSPYQIALPAASPRVNSPQMSPSSFWHAHNLRRTSRDSLSNYFNGQSATGHAGQTSASQTSLPTAAPGRRESDTELALAMNSVFANGNVLGAHRRGMSDFYGVSAMLPSPLSNVTMTAAEAVASASSISSDTNVDLAVLDSADLNNGAYGINTSTQQSSRTEIQSSSAQEAGSDAPTVASFASSASVTLLTPADFGGSFAKHAYATGEEGSNINPGIIDPNMFMALVNAMNGASASQIINSGDNSVSAGTMRYSASADQLNPATVLLDSNSLLAAQTDVTKNRGSEPQAMDWCFDWNQTSNNGDGELQHKVVADTGQAKLKANDSSTIDRAKTTCIESAASDSQIMNIDWENKNCLTAATCASEEAIVVSTANKIHN